jgi:hypothetical protein
MGSKTREADLFIANCVAFLVVIVALTGILRVDDLTLIWNWIVSVCDTINVVLTTMLEG